MDGDYRILIEDDGVGLSAVTGKNINPGDHIGLSIMKDRAKRIGGDLVIESDPGEGTRVILKFHLPVEKLPVDVKP
jgi:two-component system nitrate/nitrite sensor histidine kinase NarX